MDDLDEFFDRVGSKVKSIYNLTPEEKREIKFRYLKEHPIPCMMAMDDEHSFNDTLRDMCYLPSADYMMEIFKDRESEEFKKLSILIWNGLQLYRELFPLLRGGRRKGR